MDSTPRETSADQSSPPTFEELTRQTARMLVIPYIVSYITRMAPPPQSRAVTVIVNARTWAMTVIDGGSELQAFLGEKLGPSPASKASIEAMPVVKVEEEGKECAICLEEFDIGGEAKEMPCKHKYHSACIENWLGKRGSCPLCRYKMPVEENRREVENYPSNDDARAENEEEEEEMQQGGGGGGVVAEEEEERGSTYVFHVYYSGRRVRRRHRYSENEIDPVWNTSWWGGETDGENSGQSAQDMDIDDEPATQVMDIDTDTDGNSS